jgi:TRAP-type transport system periplasmic protein
MKSRNRTTIAALAVATLALAACGEGADGEAADADTGGDEATGDPVDLTFAHYYAEGPEVAGEARLAEEITERSDGEIDVTVHWAEALGGPTELPELVTQNAIDMGIVATHFVPDPFPFYRLQAMSFWASDDEADLRRQAELQEEVFSMEAFADELAEEHNQIALLHQPLAGYYLIGQQSGCTLDDLQGARVRSLGNDYPRMLEEVGASPVSLTTGEMYEALDRGTVDYVSIPMQHMLAYDLHEVADYACGPIFIFGNGHTTTMNLDVWESLSDDQQQLIQETADETQEWFLEHAVDQEESYREELEDLGVQFDEFDAADFEEWQERSPDFLAEWLEDMEERGQGEQAQPVYDQVREIVGE